MRSNWLYFATRSVRDALPVLICPTHPGPSLPREAVPNRADRIPADPALVERDHLARRLPSAAALLEAVTVIFIHLGRRRIEGDPPVLPPFEPRRLDRRHDRFQR